MPPSFIPEFHAWREVVLLRKGTLAFLGVILTILMVLFFGLVVQYRFFSSQIAELTRQTEVILDIDSSVSDEQRQILQVELENLPEVAQVEYWSPERSAQYVDSRIFRGYLKFLEKSELDIPLQPLFRVGLSDLGSKAALEQSIEQRYSGQLLLADSTVEPGRESFSRQLTETLQHSASLMLWLTIFSLLLVFAAHAYLMAFFLSERSHDFHLAQFLHLSPPYELWPALVVTCLGSLALIVFALLFTALLTGTFFFLLAFLLWLALLLMDMILVWFGRYLVLRWGMR